MRKTILAVMITMIVVMPVSAVEFLGVELCKDSVSTSLVLPDGSPLSLESVEVGDQGALVILLESDDSAILDQIDDLMTGVTGNRGVGDQKSLQWSGRKITAFAQVLKPKMAALAVSTTDDCLERADDVPLTTEIAPVVAAPEPSPPVTAAPAPVVAAHAEPSAEPVERVVETPSSDPDFFLEGILQHRAFGDDWVDVMGVVVNNTEGAYVLATFDLSFYDEGGHLICVDTISVSVLKDGQHRAFRDSIQCPDYRSDAVARTELQFAGGR